MEKKNAENKKRLYRGTKYLLAWIFCRVVALVFEEAVRYKEENDLTI